MGEPNGTSSAAACSTNKSAAKRFAGACLRSSYASPGAFIHDNSGCRR